MPKSAVFPLTAALLLSGPMCPSASHPFACGDETGSSCDNGEDSARPMLEAAVAAVQKDEAQALMWLTEQSRGIRTEDFCVYCIGPDHMMAAHPDPKIDHTDVLQTLIDKNDFHFGETMWKEARQGQISDITDLWPRLDGYKPSVEHRMYTGVEDQICTVGYCA